MARASAVIGLTMLGAAGAGAATIPFMGGPSLRCDAHRFPTVQACEAAGHTVCRPDGTTFVPANCTMGSGSSGRWYNSHPIYWFGGGHGSPSTSSPTHSGPSSVTTTSRSGGSGGTTTTGGGTSARGGFGSSGVGHGGSSGS